MRSTTMRIQHQSVMTVLVLLITTLLLTAGVTDAAVTGLHVTLRGKKYDIPQDVQTLSELQTAVSAASGLLLSDVTQQNVLFDGKRLDANGSLKDAGVTDGASLSMVPASTTSSKKKKKTSTSTAAVASSSSTSTTTDSSASSSSNNMDAMMKDYLAKSGIDPSQLDDMMKNMGGSGGAGGMQEAMQAMSGMMNSPIFQQYMSDPEKLEESRLMILNNPMLKGMMAGMPGMDDLLNDKDAWREAMMAAASMYQNMDQDELMKGIMGGLTGGAPPGMFDGMLDPSSSTAAAALEELDEDD